MEPNELLTIVASHYGTTTAGIRSQAKYRGSVEAREVAAFLLRLRFACSYRALAELVGCGDGRQALRLVRRCEKRLRTDERYQGRALGALVKCEAPND